MSVTLPTEHRAADRALRAELTGAYSTLFETRVIMLVYRPAPKEPAMPRVLPDGNLDHLVTPTHSCARGPVVRGQSIEVMKMHWRGGESARPHQHPEEQAI